MPTASSAIEIATTCSRVNFAAAHPDFVVNRPLPVKQLNQRVPFPRAKVAPTGGQLFLGLVRYEVEKIVDAHFELLDGLGGRGGSVLFRVGVVIVFPTDNPHAQSGERNRRDDERAQLRGQESDIFRCPN